MRSLSASSCSSLSSIDTLSGSVCSVSSLTPLPPPPNLRMVDFEREAKPDAQAEDLPRMGVPQDEAPCALGKRRRKRNAEKEAQRRAKRQKENPRKRSRPMGERIDRSKARQAMRQTVQSDKPLRKLFPSRKVDEESEVLDIETVKSKGVTVMPWDGM